MIRRPVIAKETVFDSSNGSLRDTTPSPNTKLSYRRSWHQKPKALFVLLPESSVRVLPNIVLGVGGSTCMCVMLVSNTVYFAITGPGQGGLVCVKDEHKMHELKLLCKMLTQHRLDARTTYDSTALVPLRHEKRVTALHFCFSGLLNGPRQRNSGPSGGWVSSGPPSGPSSGPSSGP